MRKLFWLMCSVLLMMSTSHATSVSKAKAAPQKVVKPKPIRVVTTLTVIAAIVKEIGGDHVVVDSLTVSGEDPHFVKSKPTLTRLVSEADLFMQIGRSLELWVPLVLAAASNDKLSGTGLVSVSAGMKPLEVPSILTRDKGDIHPQGNPHIWLSALGGLKMAENIKAALIRKDPVHKSDYEKNFVAFKARLSNALFGAELIKVADGNADFLWRQHEGKTLKEYLAKKKTAAGGWLALAAKIDYAFINYHTVWTYLIDEFNLKFFAAMEEKSGVGPSPKYINQLIDRAKAAHVTHIFDASYYIGHSVLIERVAHQIGGRKLFIDADCKPGETFVAMMDRILKDLVAFKNAPAPKKK